MDLSAVSGGWIWTKPAETSFDAETITIKANLRREQRRVGKPTLRAKLLKSNGCRPARVQGMRPCAGFDTRYCQTVLNNPLALAALAAALLCFAAFFVLDRMVSRGATTAFDRRGITALRLPSG